MKNLLTILLFLLATNSQAQYSYNPMPFDNGIWSCKAVDDWPRFSTNIYSYHLITNGDDTIANGIKYYKVYHRDSYFPKIHNYNNLIDIARKTDVCIGGIREDTSNRIIYYRNFFHQSYSTTYSDSFERAIYNFNQIEGDTIPITTHDTSFSANAYYRKYVIKKVDTVTINGKMRKRFHIYNANDTATNKQINVGMIEGIGSMGGLLTDLNFYHHLFKYFVCLNNGNYTYHHDTFYKCFYIHPYGTPVGINELTTQTINIYPNPTIDKITIETPVSTHIIVYNSTGKIVATKTSKTTKETIDLQELPNGLYIINLHNEQLGIDQRKKLMKL
ncbi:MAG: T9SS type A sorting domain-containing protein [Flavipsychrobacter sp.]